MVQYIYSEEYRLAHYYMLYNLLISDKKIEIGTQVRGLVDGMLEAIEVIYVTLIKKKNSRLFDFTKKMLIYFNDI